MNLKNQLLLGFAALILASCGGGNTSTETSKDSTANKEETKTATTVEVAVNPLKDCFFGDLHLHTSLSADANFLGTNTLPEDSYKYAMGQEVNYMGQKVKRNAPLDFLAVTDHAEYLGAIAAIRDPKGLYVGTALYKLYNSTDQKDMDAAFVGFNKDMAANKPDTAINKPDVIKSGWQKLITAAEAYNKPGKFTTFIGYEWTSAPLAENKGQQNLHRCVIFKGNKVPNMPYSCFESLDPEDLWTYLENARKTGSDVLAVPHNGNVSN